MLREWEVRARRDEPATVRERGENWRFLSFSFGQSLPYRLALRLR